MPDWYWDDKRLKNTPSKVKGMKTETEERYRREGVRFIRELGGALNLSHITMATASVFFHRFYMFHRFQDFPRYPLSTCCLFLAGKSEETPKKCRDVIRTARQLTNDRIFDTFGEDPKEEILALEKVLLQTIRFDLQVDHPYSHLIFYGKSLVGDKAKIEKLVQMSWTFINDSFCTKVCLKWEPEIVAVSVMYLAMKLMKFDAKDWENRLSHQKFWWDPFVEGLEQSDCEDICHQLLDLYGKPSLNTRDLVDSPPPCDDLEDLPFFETEIVAKIEHNASLHVQGTSKINDRNQGLLSPNNFSKAEFISPERSITPPPPPLPPDASDFEKPPPPPDLPWIVKTPTVPPSFHYPIPLPLSEAPIRHAFSGFPPPPIPPPLQAPSIPIYPTAPFYQTTQGIYSQFISIPPPFTPNPLPPTYDMSQPPPPLGIRGHFRYTNIEDQNL